MHYPFYKYIDIKILYIFIGIFVAAFIVSLFFMKTDIWIRILVAAVVGIFALLIVLIGHEIMTLMLRKTRKK